MQVMAVLCSDVHLSHSAPLCRTGERDWYQAQERVLGEVIGLANHYRCPLVVAGDIFDRWNSPPELVNFAIDIFRQAIAPVYAIPGQHDLPNHVYGYMHKSAYGTLVKSGAIKDLRGQHGPTNYKVHGITVSLYGFPWGFPVQPPSQPSEGMRLAVVHQYIWKKGKGYPGAPEESRYTRMIRNLQGYTAAVFGDNHKGFLVGVPTENGIIHVLNNGGLMRRKSDEMDYTPQVGLLTAEGTIHVRGLDVSEDVIDVREKTVEKTVEMDRFDEYVKDLKDLDSGSIDFREHVYRMMDYRRVNNKVRKHVLDSMGEGTEPPPSK